MSRRARASGGSVRGPASALTSFLAGLGVEPSHQVTTWGNTTSLSTDAQSVQVEQDLEAVVAGTAPTYSQGLGQRINGRENVDPARGVTARNVEAGPSQVGQGTPKRDADDDVDSDDLDAKPKRRRRAVSVDSDDLDAPTTSAGATTNGTGTGTSTPITSASKKTNIRKEALKAIGEFMNCGECAKKFTVTAYTKEHPNQPQTWLCVECCYKVGVDPFAKAKKGGPGVGGAKKSQPKQDRGKVIHYEERKGASSLSDLCIMLISKYIEDVEQLGYIGSINMDKVCKIISKSRRLNSETAKLFYSTDRNELEMYDCTALVHQSYLTMATLCPNLTELRLHLCGQIQTDTLKAWSKFKHFPFLRHIELDGPFLVRQEGWETFLQSHGKNLEGFLITQSPRIDLEVIEVLADSCPNLKQLRLAEIEKLNDACLVPLAKLKNLQILDLSSPGNSLSDEGVVELLKSVGSGLEELVLSDNSDLTDLILDAIIQFCPSLLRLKLRNLDLTDEGVSKFFKNLSKSTRNSSKHIGFTVLDLEKGHELGTASLEALLDHSGETIEELSILGWKEVDAETISKIGANGDKGGDGCRQLRSLNLSWCRKVTDFTLKDILEGCPKIEEIRVWGCNELTDAVPRKKGVKVIGIETHSI